MACGSVAVSKATIGKMIFKSSDLAIILAKLLNVDPDSVYQYESSWGDFRESSFYNPDNRLTYRLSQQTASNGDIESVLSITGYDPAAAADQLAELQPKLDRLLMVQTQSVILRKLAQLGKLSAIKQLDRGVTAKIEINI